MGKIFVAVEAYTENCIGSVGFISCIDAYTTKEEAYAKIRKNYTGTDNECNIHEHMMTQADGRTVLEATCSYSDFEGNEIRWTVKEIDIP